ncbi:MULTISPECIES: Spy/CpxP family protein refolding chaperone [unclassified Agarivorans]|uniref:Spy/CpxP family protein refolding chaperone n=1 Tax=unclassified Agarivorans TaxID=2636026 RepID=UPI003D7C8CD4
MKKLLVTTLLGTLILAPAAFAANGNRHDGEGMRDRDGHPRMHLMRELDLTAAQKAQVKEIMQANKPSGETKQRDGERAQRNMMHQQHMAIVTSATFDENAAKNLLKKEQEKHQQRALHMMRSQNAIYQILTPEQQQKFQQLTEQRMEKRGQMKKDGKHQNYQQGEKQHKNAKAST